jgi:hypothetical protein
MLNLGSTQYINSIINNRNENKYYKNKDTNKDIVNNENIIKNPLLNSSNSLIQKDIFNMDNNVSYKEYYYNNTISSNIYNRSPHTYNRSKYTIINKRHINHNKTKPIYNTETLPTTNPILKRPITVEDIIIKNNLQIKEYNNALLEKKTRDITNTYNKSWELNFDIINKKKKCKSC